MASISRGVFAPGSAWALSMAFVERQTNLWKRYWGWELVWIVYGVVNTLAITFIAEELGRRGATTPDAAQRHAGVGVPIRGPRRHLARRPVGALGGYDRAHADGAGAARAAPAGHVRLRRAARRRAHAAHLRHRALLLQRRFLASELAGRGARRRRRQRARRR